jgi:hypothetical protein
MVTLTLNAARGSGIHLLFRSRFERDPSLSNNCQLATDNCRASAAAKSFVLRDERESPKTGEQRSFAVPSPFLGRGGIYFVATTQRSRPAHYSFKRAERLQVFDQLKSSLSPLGFDVILEASRRHSDHYSRPYSHRVRSKKQSVLENRLLTTYQPLTTSSRHRSRLHLHDASRRHRTFPRKNRQNERQ